VRLMMGQAAEREFPDRPVVEILPLWPRPHHRKQPARVNERPTSRSEHPSAKPGHSATEPESRPALMLSVAKDIPFDKVRLSERNLRRLNAGVSIEDLAEDISPRTLVQRLPVRRRSRPTAPKPAYSSVQAGSRRFQALERQPRSPLEPEPGAAHPNPKVRKILGATARRAVPTDPHCSSAL